MICGTAQTLDSYILPAQEVGATQATGYSITLLDKASQLAPHLNGNRNSTFQCLPFLEAQEMATPNGMGFRYALVKCQADVCAILFFQLMPLNFAQSLPGQPGEPWWKRTARKLVPVNALVCGSLLNSGFLGCQPLGNFPNEVLPACLEYVRKELRKEGKKFNLLFAKDFSPELGDRFRSAFEQKGFHEFHAQPAMWMNLPEEWLTFEDYLNALHSKSRIRAKRAQKKGAELERAEISSPEEIAQLIPQTYPLYLEVSKEADFNTFTLQPQYFSVLKKMMADKFHFFTYTYEGKVIAFYTLLENGDTLEAHFLGLNHSFNPSHQAYLNILFDMVNFGIEHRFKKIHFARTALEIKSSVGAVPENLTFYLKHTNPIINRLLPWIYKRFSPPEEWQPRHPFK